MLIWALSKHHSHCYHCQDERMFKQKFKTSVRTRFLRTASAGHVLLKQVQQSELLLLAMCSNMSERPVIHTTSTQAKYWNEMIGDAYGVQTDQCLDIDDRRDV
jgi:hypothetical protein